KWLVATPATALRSQPSPPRTRSATGHVDVPARDASWLIGLAGNAGPLPRAIRIAGRGFGGFLAGTRGNYASGAGRWPRDIDRQWRRRRSLTRGFGDGLGANAGQLVG